MDLSASLKTRMDYKMRHMLVFTTDKTMHERFSFKRQKCVFILNNGYTSPFRNNDVKGRIVFPYKHMDMPFHKHTTEEKEFDERLDRWSKQRRTVLKPSKLEKRNKTEYIDAPLDFWSKRFISSTPRPRLKLRRYNFITRRFSGSNDRYNREMIFSPMYLPGRYRYRRQFPYKWRRRRVSKAQLDDEIDEYMAEVRSVKLQTFSNDEEDDQGAF